MEAPASQLWVDGFQERQFAPLHLSKHLLHSALAELAREVRVIEVAKCGAARKTTNAADLIYEKYSRR